jgi:hypothetical protein
MILFYKVFTMVTTEAQRDKRKYAWDVMYKKAIDSDGNVYGLVTLQKKNF